MSFSLTDTLPVPVYDGRKTDFNPDTDIGRVHEVFPAWDDEVPLGSFAVVAYTTSIYAGKNDQTHVSCNVQWVLILGSPT